MNTCCRCGVLLCTMWLLSGGVLRAQDLLLDYDPLLDITAEMQVAAGHLNKLNTGKPTQTSQNEVVSKLDALIEELEKQCANCRGGAANANPSRPAQDSVIKGGPGGIGKLHAARDGGKKWGELPPHERERILQSMTDGFPAHYQKILERYYRQLADEKPISESDGAADVDKTTEGAAVDRSATPSSPDSNKDEAQR